MALTFPDSPPIGDLYTAENGVVYEWNGTTWDVEVAGTQYWTGDNDAISYVGDIGVGGSSSFAGSAYFASDVGIGNSNPRGPIHIGADLTSGASDAAAINLKQTGVTASTGIYLERSGERRGYYMYLGSASDSLTFQRNDVGAKSDVLRLTRDGDAEFTGTVNIGDWSGSSAGVVSGPSGYVHVRKDGGSNAIGVWNGAGGSPTVSIDPDGSATFAADITVGDFDLNATNVSGSKIHSSGAIQLQRPAGATASSRVTIYSGTTPNVQLLDNGNASFAGKLLAGTTGDDGNAKALVRGGVGTNIGVFDIQSNSGSTSINSGSALGYLRFKAGDSGASNYHAAYIGCLLNGPSSGAADVPGALIFGTAPDGTASPVERMMLDNSGGLYHNSSNQGIATFLTQSAGTVKYAFRGHYGSPAGNYGGTISFTVWSNGNVENTNNSYGAISDVTLKENIVPASEQWDNIKDIEVVNYNFKEETGNETHKQLGVIAQQVEEVSPGLVKTDEEGLKSVNYSVLYMKSVKALQEAMERIEILEQRLSDAGL